MEESNVMIKEYAKNPLCNFSMESFTVKQHEGNFICWDDIVVYLKIENNNVIEYSFDGNCSTITTAAASLLSEIIVWVPIYEIFDLELYKCCLYDLMYRLEGKELPLLLYWQQEMQFINIFLIEKRILLKM